MTKTIVTITACATLLWAGTALATPTPQQQLRQRPHHGVEGLRSPAWMRWSRRTRRVAISFDEFTAFWKCRHAYFKKWTGFQGEERRCAASTCDQGGRFKDNGDQTVTDNLSGLVWEKKDNLDDSTNFADPHDADNDYTWSTGRT